MIWLAIVLGLLVAAFGATAGAALITVSRAAVSYTHLTLPTKA